MPPLRERVRTSLDGLVDIRHDLHAHPELGYEEVRTNGVIRGELTRLGIEHVGDLAGGTGVLAHIPGGKGDSIALRADIDALPIEERTELAWASTHEGRMHACGHDGHTTMLLGAARVLKALSDAGDLPRPVTLFFQPAEEGGAGAKRMIADGCLDGSVLGPAVTRVFGLHNFPGLPFGTVWSRPGPIFAAADQFEILIEGRGSHAAWPQGAQDPIIAGAAVVSALQTIVSRNTSPTDAVVVSVTQFNAGSAFNIIPPEAELRGTVRTLTEETQEMARRRLTEIAEGVAAAHGCRANVTYHVGYPPTVNDPECVETFEAIAREALGDDRVSRLPAPVMGGEDFAYYCHEVPSCFFVVGTGGPEPGPGLHESTFDFNDEMIPLGVEMLCRMAIGGAR